MTLTLTRSLSAGKGIVPQNHSYNTLPPTTDPNEVAHHRGGLGLGLGLAEQLPGEVAHHRVGLANPSPDPDPDPDPNTRWRTIGSG